MAEKPAETRPRRVAVILGPGGSGRALLDVLQPLLLRDRGIEMHGVFIEESEVRHAAELPFVQELCRVTFSVREFNSAQFERALALRMRTARKALSLLAARAGVQMSFENLRGSALSLLQQTAADADVTVFEPVRLPVAASTAPRRRRPRIVVAVAEPELARPALQAAADLAEGHGAALTVLTTDGPALEGAWRERFPGRPLRLRVVAAESGARGLVEAANAEGAALLVLAASDPLLQPSSLRVIRERLRCPICLVRRWEVEGTGRG